MPVRYTSRWSRCHVRPPRRRIAPAVDVSASGIIETNAMNPTVMYGRFAMSSQIDASRLPSVLNAKTPSGKSRLAKRSATRYVRKCSEP
jgi:hypothetical protein